MVLTGTAAVVNQVLHSRSHESAGVAQRELSGGGMGGQRTIDCRTPRHRRGIKVWIKLNKSIPRAEDKL